LASDSPESPGVSESVARVRVNYRLLEITEAFLRDVGVTAPLSGFSLSLTPDASKSSVVHLDETQREVLERGAVKTEQLREIDVGTLWLWAGERRTARFPDDGVLTLRTTPSRDGRFVFANIRLRFLRSGVFSPRVHVPVPDSGTVLVFPHDAMIQPTDPSPPVFLLLTFSVSPN
jgi:hypothetical protein